MAPVFETERLIARALTERDAEDAFEIYGDAEVTRYVTSDGAPIADLETMRLVIASDALAPLDDPRFGLWALEAKGDRELVGVAGLIPVEATGEHELGWHLARRNWGRGYAFESGVALLTYAFDVVGLDRVIALVRPENERSLRACARIGMSPDGSMRHQDREHRRFTAARAHWSPPRARSDR